MESHPAWSSLMDMGMSETMSKAAIRNVKSEDVGALIDWIDNHSG